MEEKAAFALEASAAQHMQEADFEAAESMWSSAILLRESLHAEETLRSLKCVSGGTGDAGGAPERDALIAAGAPKGCGWQSGGHSGAGSEGDLGGEP